MADLMDFMKQQCDAQLLKYAAGRVMFCPVCETCLDWRETVSIDFRGEKSGKLHSTQTLCTKCADKLLPGLHDRLTKAEEKAGERILIETTDGRDWNDDEEFDPAPNPKQGYFIEFTAAKRAGPEAEHGFEVVQGLQDWGRFVCYDSKDNPGFWFVCELMTGYAIAKGDSFRSAVINGFRNLRKVGRDRFREVVGKVPVLNNK